MEMTLPNALTIGRIALVPVLVLFFYLPFSWANMAAVAVFVFAAATDWLDGFIARKTNQHSSFGAFLDPVADKIMVATALILLVQQHSNQIDKSGVLFAIAAAVIVGREITVSALREWMSELGERGVVRVTWWGKSKTIFQMTAIGFLLYRDPILGLPIALIGEILLYIAATLTLWSMWEYISSAWPAIRRQTELEAEHNVSKPTETPAVEFEQSVTTGADGPDSKQSS